ncbi:MULTISPECIES: TetR/AcrR family transcriptional regulator [Natrialbaceae]|uniref:TetR/AcrR family transcriptional regulator n=3 Tax=Halobacteriales TaxID=2235 RepID=UPI00207C5F7C|nr:TetR/AcrR family transcriptional regulator [Natronococcus sp. CG52]
MNVQPMGSMDLFEDEPASTREAIMQATYRALRKHGYAGLTIQRIGDEFPKSKSLLYHHYDGKDALLLEFLSFMLERFEATIPDREYGDAREHLEAILDHALPTDLDSERAEFRAAMVELRAQAATDEAYREHFTRNDRFFRRRLATVVRRGIEEGVFRDVDPERAAAMVLSSIHGAMQEEATTDTERTAAVREELRAYVESRLLAPDVELEAIE